MVTNFLDLTIKIETKEIWKNMLSLHCTRSAAAYIIYRTPNNRAQPELWTEIVNACPIKQPKLFSLNCLCHLAALCAAAALKKLPVSVDEFLINIFYHFKHSSKRYSEFSAIREEFSDIVPLWILKHCTTRWLSLERCVKRLLDQWPALYAYFDKEAESDRNARLQRIAKNTEVKLLCHFVSYAFEGVQQVFSCLSNTC